MLNFTLTKVDRQDTSDCGNTHLSFPVLLEHFIQLPFPSNGIGDCGIEIGKMFGNDDIFEGGDNGIRRFEGFENLAPLMGVGIGEFSRFQNNLFPVLALGSVGTGQAIGSISFSFVLVGPPMKVKWLKVHEYIIRRY